MFWRIVFALLIIAAIFSPWALTYAVLRYYNKIFYYPTDSAPSDLLDKVSYSAQFVNLWFSIVAFVALALAVFIQRKQMLAFNDSSQQQLEELRNSIDAQNKIGHVTIYTEITRILQSDNARILRRNLFYIYENKPYKDWEIEDKELAGSVAAQWDICAKMASIARLPDEDFIGHWAYSLTRSWASTSNFINERRRRDDPQLWVEFEKAALRAKDILQQRKESAK